MNPRLSLCDQRSGKRGCIAASDRREEASKAMAGDERVLCVFPRETRDA